MIAPKYSIVIPTYNHLEDALRPCLESIIKTTDLSDVEVIVVANGCTDGTKDYVESLGNPFKLVWIDKAAGYTKSTNAGIKVAQGEYIILLNNDNVILDFMPKNDWINMLVNPFINNEKVGITGAAKNFHEGTGRDFLLFFCVMISRKIINKFGLLDEIFNPGYGEDIDYCHKIRKEGYEVVQVPNDVNITSIRSNDQHSINFPIWHKSSVTVHGVPGWEDIVKRNEKILSERYTLKPTVQSKKSRICIIVQATGSYNIFVKDLVESINAYFMTDCYKDVVILSDVMAPSTQSLGENCLIHNRLCKNYNKASYFFELMLENLDLIYTSDYCYKMDADMLVYKKILGNDILPGAEQNYSIVKHFSFDQKYMSSIRPKDYSANIKEEYQNGPYWQSCLFGGRAFHMIKMANELDEFIKKDRANNSMWGAWEEPYVNWFLSSRQKEVKTLSPSYACPLYWSRFPTNYREVYNKSVDIPEQIFHYNHTVQFGGHQLG